MKKKRVTLKIYGVVQGVFFRYNTVEKAKELQITGWAKNEPDDTVVVDAEGEENNLKKFINWCNSGPEHAKVEKIDITWNEFDNLYSNFEIK